MIAGLNERGCFHRAISTMRLALGYDTPLPDGWDNDDVGVRCRDIPALLPVAFPGRKVQVWHAREGNFSNGGIYMGEDYSYSLANNLFITAFTYTDEEGIKGHCVIGEPIVYDNGPKVSFIWRVSLFTVGED